LGLFFFLFLDDWLGLALVFFKQLFRRYDVFDGWELFLKLLLRLLLFEMFGLLLVSFVCPLGLSVFGHRVPAITILCLVA